MRPPAPITPTRRVSFAPRTRVDARAVSPPAMIKLRRSSRYVMASILAGGDQGRKCPRQSGGHPPETRPNVYFPRASRDHNFKGFRMDNFKEIGRRIDAEMERLRRYVDQELTPETEK